MPASRRPVFRRLRSVTVIFNVEKILKCRTGQLGFHAYKCPKCREVKLIPHSCKSRFCSSCGKIATDRWIGERLSDILPVEYHHQRVYTSLAIKNSMSGKPENNV